jgi:hypothetical protein
VATKNRAVDILYEVVKDTLQNTSHKGDLQKFDARARLYRLSATLLLVD